MRAVLLAPPGGAQASFASGADALIFDLDGAPLPAPPPGLKLYPRIAPLDESRSQADLETAVALRPAGIALPLSRGGADVQRLGARLAVLEAEAGLPDGAIRILAFAAETPEALFGLASYRGASARLEALIHTAEPLAVALGRTRPLRLAREMTLVAARAAGVLALEGPGVDPHEARAEGFDGQLALDAAELALVRAAFG